MAGNSKKNLRAFIFFLASAGFFLVVFGYAVGKYKIFPYPVISYAHQGYKELKKQLFRVEPLRGKTGISPAIFWIRSFKGPRFPYKKTKAYSSLNLVTKVCKDFTLQAQIMDMNYQVLHEWSIDWFTLWPDAPHVPREKQPKSKPGTQIHGAVIMDNGDLVFNFDHLGLLRLGRGGEVVWRLPYLTHHSVHRHDDGNLWVSGQRWHTVRDARLPNRVPPFYEDTILEVTPDGRISEEWSVADIFMENGLTGLLYMGSLLDVTTQVKGDLLHLNDVEPFPASMEPGFFKQGDILVSLRNINTVFVFNRKSRKIKFICTGWFVRQHDADFLDGNRFSVFDNNHIAEKEYNPQSRIVIVSAPDRKAEVYFAGSEEIPFYTKVLGKHQWLPNGNLLITESCYGRAFEINKGKEIVWDYINFFDKDRVIHVTEVQRLDPDVARLFETEKMTLGAQP